MRRIFDYFKEYNVEAQRFDGIMSGGKGFICLTPDESELLLFDAHSENLEEYRAKFKIEGKRVFASINMDGISDETRNTVGNVWEKCLLSAA